MVFEDPGSVPDNWKPANVENLEEGVGGSLTVDYAPPGISDSNWQSGESSGRRRPVGFCGRCQNGKPPRCHHCSICELTFLPSRHFTMYALCRSRWINLESQSLFKPSLVA